MTATKFKVECDSLLCASSSGSTVVVSTDAGTVVVIGDHRQPGSVETATVQAGCEISSVHLKRSFPHHFYSACERRIHLSDRRNLTETVCTYAFNTDDINHVVASKCDKYLCSADDSGRVEVIAVAKNELHATLENHDSVCFCLATVGDRDKLISGGYDCKMFLNDFMSARVVQRFNIVEEINNPSPFINPPNVLGVDTSTNGNYLAAALQNGTICVWQRSRNQRYKKSYVVDDAHSSLGATQVKFFGDGNKRFVSGGNDGMIKLWNRDDLTKPFKVIHHGAKINWLQIVRGYCLAVCDTSNELTLLTDIV